MTESRDNDRRIKRIRSLLNCDSDVELAKRLDTNQPQISRWRRGGFARSTAALIDALLLIISRRQREINQLKEELVDAKHTPSKD